jgi:His-Xaa-Ser system radical SAM maturase HxsC
MGVSMTPLPLSETAKSITGLAESRRRLIRLRRADSGPVNEADAAIIRGDVDLAAALERGFSRAVIFESRSRNEPLEFVLVAHLDPRFDYLSDGDVIALDPRSRRFRVLYRRESKNNTFLVTERCNHYCLMCSQPPRKVDDGWIVDEISGCLDLIDPATASIGFTGGEPLLERHRFLALLLKMRNQLPDTAVHVLTNGRAFADDSVATAWAEIRHPDLWAGIPIYAAVDHIHDYVVQARGAFDETVLGILRLKDKGQRVEVRVVLHAIIAPRLKQTCEWFARNLSFVDHIALMGLENTGFALANQELLLDRSAGLCGRPRGRRPDAQSSRGQGIRLQSAPLCAGSIGMGYCGSVHLGLEERLPTHMLRMRGPGSLLGLFLNGSATNKSGNPAY